MTEDDRFLNASPLFTRRQAVGAVVGAGLNPVIARGWSIASPVVIEPASAAFGAIVETAAVARTPYAEGRRCEGPVWPGADGSLIFCAARG